MTIRIDPDPRRWRPWRPLAGHRRAWTALLVLLLSALLVGPAEAQRGRRGGGRGGGRSGGSRNNKGREAQQAAKAQKAAEQKAKQQLQQKTAQIKKWVEARKKQAAAREAQLKARASAASPADAGPMFRTHCASCHSVPDPTFPSDGTWLAALDDTHCRELPPELALAMTSYLREATEFRPHSITSYAEPAPGNGSVTSDITGELFLRAESGAQFRLVWGPGQAGEKRVLAPGKYTLTGYRLFKGPWTLSASGGDRSLVVRPDANQNLSVPPTLRLELNVLPAVAQARLNGANLAFTLRDLHGQALSVYRDGKRLPIPFQVETKTAGATQHGVMAYTSEGRAEASIEIPLGEPASARVDLPHDFPFALEGSRRVALPPAR